MDGASLLTVAIPTCNGARHLREALAGIQAQQGVDYELIVSDDRSEDDSVAIVREEVGDRARVSVNSERLGLAGNWNRCFELSRTPWVALFHQDDVMHPGHLESHRDSIDSNPGVKVGLIGGRVEMVDDAGRAVSPSVVDPGGLVDGRVRPDGPETVVFGPEDWSVTLLVGNPLRCSAITTCKAAHTAVGGFDTSFRYAVDWDFWARVACDWGLIWRNGPPSVAMRWHPESETHRFKTGTTDLDEQIRLLEVLHSWHDGDHAELRRLADRRLARAFLNRAHVALKGGDVRLARCCLARSVHLSRAVLGTIALDPRLAAQMAVLAIAPDLAGRWFGRVRS